MAKVLRNKSIKIRVTEAEKAKLRKRSKCDALAEWMRDHCLGAEIVPQVTPPKSRKHREPPSVAPELLRELAQLGNNLNQLARRVNSGEFNASDAVVLTSLLNGIAADLKDIKQGHSHDR